MAAYRRSHLVAVVLCAAVATGAAGAGSNLELGLVGGQASYREHVTIDPIESEWDAPTLGLDVQWTSAPLHASGVQARLSGAWDQSLSAEEQWMSGSTVVQRNDLEVHHLDFRAEAGRPWAMSPHTEFTPWLGGGLRRQGFRRSAFRSGDGVLTDPGSVSEDFDIGYLDLALGLSHAWNEKWSVTMRASVAYVFHYRARNSAFGTIDGDGGESFDVDAGVRYALDEGQDVGLGVMYAAQNLEGSVDETIVAGPDGAAYVLQLELPDNDYERLVFYARWRKQL